VRFLGPVIWVNDERAVVAEIRLVKIEDDIGLSGITQWSLSGRQRLIENAAIEIVSATRPVRADSRSGWR